MGGRCQRRPPPGEDGGRFTPAPERVKAFPPWRPLFLPKDGKVAMQNSTVCRLFEASSALLFLLALFSGLCRLACMRILGLDPGLTHTGWGVIDATDGRLRHVADGRISPPVALPMADRLAFLDSHLDALIRQWTPDSAAVEETFVNMNAASTLKLGQARGVVLLAPARAGLGVAEYATNLVKKTVVGSGHAAKAQVGMMVGVLLNIRPTGSADAADALAVAICHAHHQSIPLHRRLA